MHRFYTVQRILSTDELAEHGMFAVEMGCLGESYEELRFVCTWSAICHCLFCQTGTATDTGRVQNLLGHPEHHVCKHPFPHVHL